jgi:hypothetical protein
MLRDYCISNKRAFILGRGQQLSMALVSIAVLIDDSAIYVCLKLYYFDLQH